MQEHHTRTRRRSRGSRVGFSLVELLAVVAVIGTLVSLSLPAVQHAREAARRTSCSNNLHQMGLALSGYEAARRSFPPGDDAITFRHHAWSSFILPYLEEGNLGHRVDYSRRWNAVGGNADLADQVVSTYICPSGMERFPGKQDYGGILGTSVQLDDTDPLPFGFEHAGVLYATAATCPRPVGLPKSPTGSRTRSWSPRESIAGSPTPTACRRSVMPAGPAAPTASSITRPCSTPVRWMASAATTSAACWVCSATAGSLS